MPNQAISVEQIKQQQKRAKITRSEATHAVCLFRGKCKHKSLMILFVAASASGSEDGERWKMFDC
jgi:hypothetical protein